MINEVYTLIKNRLAASLPDVPTDYYLGQYLQAGDDHVTTTPILYIHIAPLKWETYPGNVQKATMTFEVHAVTQTAYGDEGDILDTDYIDHVKLVQNVYRSLQGKNLKAGDITLLNGIVRTGTAWHSELNNLMVTVQTFECRTIDLYALPNWVEVLASLRCTIIKVNNLHEL